MTTTNKSLAQPTYNSEVNTWGIGSLNNNFSYIDLALGGSVTLNATGLSGNVDLVLAEYRPLTIRITGTPAGILNYRVPNGVGGLWVVRNDTPGTYTVAVQSLGGGSGISIPAGSNTMITCDGSATGMRLAITATAAAAGSNTWVQFNSGGLLGASANLAFDGSTLFTTGLNNAGNTTLGDAAGDTVTVNANTMAIPNTLNIGSDTIWMTSATKQVGIGTTVVGSDKLVVAGTVKSAAGGFVFPDSSTQTTAAALPPGVIVPYGAASAPAGWLTCAAQAVSRTTYSALFAVIGTTYGAGDGSTTFNLPDLRGRVVAGVDNQGGFGAAGRLTGTSMSPNGNTIGATGGSQNVTLTASQQASMPVTGTFTGTITSPTTPTNTSAEGANFGNAPIGGGQALYGAAGTVGGTISGTAAGSGNPHENTQPTILLYYIIKT